MQEDNSQNSSANNNVSDSQPLSSQPQSLPGIEPVNSGLAGGNTAPVNPQFGTPSVAPVQPSSAINPDFNNQKKKVMIIASIVVVIIVLGAVLALIMMGSKESVEEPQPESQSSVEEKSDIVAINKLDDKYGQYRIQEADMGKEYSNPRKPSLYVNFDDSTSYFIEHEPEQWRLYKLDNMYNYTDVHGSVSGNNECDKFLSNNQDKITTVINTLKDNGFSYRQPKSIGGGSKFYSQSPECSQGGLYTSSDNLCSTKFDAFVRTDNDDGTSEVVPEISVACSSRDSLNDKISRAIVAKQIYIDIKQPVDGFIMVPDYVKDSQTAGYKIAEINGGASSSVYYKKGDHTWQRVDDLNCTTFDANPSIKAAFKGEECYDSATSANRVI